VVENSFGPHSSRTGIEHKETKRTKPTEDQVSRHGGQAPFRVSRHGGQAPFRVSGGTIRTWVALLGQDMGGARRWNIVFVSRRKSWMGGSRNNIVRQAEDREQDSEQEHSGWGPLQYTPLEACFPDNVFTTKDTKGTKLRNTNT
jgi:hypothetical protein